MGLYVQYCSLAMPIVGLDYITSDGLLCPIHTAQPNWHRVGNIGVNLTYFECVQTAGDSNVLVSVWIKLRTVAGER